MKKENTIIVALAVLAAVIAHAPKPTLFEIPLSKGYVFYLTSTILGVLGLVIFLGSLPLYFVLVPVGAAAILGSRVYRSLPAAFAMSPFDPEEEAAILAAEPGR